MHHFSYYDILKMTIYSLTFLLKHLTYLVKCLTYLIQYLTYIVQILTFIIKYKIKCNKIIIIV